ncbi:MAG: formylglycine-generating enzyme family protein [Acidobacteria bacterium]|nr:formylglycine-generating enzyme family protein [Acidobacteriota bacterium]
MSVNIEPEMVIIPGGDFLMGCETGAVNERPVHRVWVDCFALGRYPVTNRLYRIYLKEARRQAPHGLHEVHFNHADQPVTSVSWFDAVDYCTWLRECTGIPFRLPTEAEWERAARGGLESKRYTWGDDPPQSQPRYSELWRNGPERIGIRTANQFGLYDISENVHEWCTDWYDAEYYKISPLRNPQGPTSGERRVSRGGSWRHQIKIARVAARSSIPPEYQYSDYGFRCALSL